MKSILIYSLLLFTLSSLSAQEVKHSFLVGGSGMKKVVLVNEDGTIEWEYPSEKEVNDVSMLSNGSILFSDRVCAKLVNRKQEILWEYRGPKGTEIQSASPLKNGNILIIQNGAPAKLMEINRKGKVKFEMVIPTEQTKVHRQFRNIRKTKRGTYLIGHFGDGKLCEYNKKGEVLRTIPNVGNAFIGVELKNGNILIACGDAHKLVEVDKNNSIVWSINENEIPGHPLRFVAGVQRLANGNTVICNWGGHGHREKQAQVFEVTPDKNVVWEIRDWDKFKTISSIQITDEKGKMEKGNLQR